MDGHGDYQTKWSKSEKDKYIAYCTILKGTNELIYKTETYRLRKQIYGYQRRSGGGKY